MDGLAADSFKTLNEKDRRKGAPVDLVLDVGLIFLDADGGKLLGQIGIAKVVALRTDLTSVDRCLLIFGSDIDPNTIKPKATLDKTPWLPKGAGTRTALEILRETGEPMSTPELAASILQRYGKPLEERALHRLVATIQGNFSRRRDGIVEFDRSTYPGKWRLAQWPLLSGPK